MPNNQAPSILKLYLLGTPLIQLNDNPVTGLPAKTQALLFYLAVTRQPHLRTVLTTLLWGDLPERNARANLRKAIQQLRAAIPAHLIVAGQSVALRTDATTWTDVGFCDAHITRVEKSGAIHDLTEVIEQHRGDFLAGFFVRGAPDFEVWQLTQQVNRREQMVGALQAQSQYWSAQGELANAIAATRRVIDVEPWREEVHRQLMALLAQDGQRSAALAHYELCKRVLAEELGVKPDNATEALYQQLQQRPPVPSVIAKPPRFTTKADYTLVGRADEWQQLQRCWQTLTRPHFFCISGEAGIGKTRLAEELLLLAERNGQRVARARYHAMQGRLAYGPVADWLRSTAFREPLAQLDPLWLSELARLLPELLIQHPTLDAPQPMHEAWQRKQLFEALAYAFTQEQGPLLLILDDLQWCDVDTLEWLHYLLGRAMVPLLVVGTVRSDEVATDHPLHGLRHQLQRNDQFTEIALAPLTVRATSALAAQIAGQPLTDQRAAALYQEMAGNPLFIIERVHMGLSGEAIPTLQSAAIGGIAQQSVIIPPKMYSVIQSRLTQLSPQASRLAQLMATIGRAFDVELLSRATNQSAEAVLNTLDELWRRRIIHEVDTIHFDYSHDRIRDVAYAEIPPLKRRLLHRQVAQLLDDMPKDHFSSISGQLGFHYQESNLFELAMTAYLQAADAARQLFAHAEIIDYQQKALNMARQLPESENRSQREIDLLIDLGFEKMWIYGPGNSQVGDCWYEALELANTAGTIQQRYRALRSCELFHRNRGEWRKAYVFDHKALVVAEESGETFLNVCAISDLGGTAQFLGNFKLAQSYLEQVLAYPEIPMSIQANDGLIGNPYLISCYSLVPCLWLLGYPEQAASRARQAMQRIQDPAFSNAPLKLYTMDLVMMMIIFSRDFSAVVSHAAVIQAEATKQDMHVFIQLSRMYKDWAIAHSQDPVTLVQSVQVVVHGLHDLGLRMWEPHWRGMLAEIQILAGQTEKAMTEIDEALNFARSEGGNYWNAQLLKLKGDCLWTISASMNEIERCYQDAIDVAHHQNAHSLELRATTSLCRLWQQQGRQDEAHPLLAGIYGWFTEGFDTPDLVEAKALLTNLRPGESQ